jgi:hypothetical protein
MVADVAGSQRYLASVAFAAYNDARGYIVSSASLVAPGSSK